MTYFQHVLIRGEYSRGNENSEGLSCLDRLVKLVYISCKLDISHEEVNSYIIAAPVFWTQLLNLTV